MTRARACVLGQAGALALAAAALAWGCGDDAGAEHRAPEPPDQPARPPDDARAPDDAPVDAGPLRDAAPPGALLVPAGTTWRGCTKKHHAICNDPLLEVDVEAAFYIDEVEVPVGAYERCVRAGRCTPPVAVNSCDETTMTWGRDKAMYPVNCVTAFQAQEYCEFVGGSLPTWHQWLRAARGDDQRPYPWGWETPTCARAVIENRRGDSCGTGGPLPVVGRPNGASPFGVRDLSGNVAEIVIEFPDYGAPRMLESAASVGGDYQWASDEYVLQVWATLSAAVREYIGFRWAYGP